MKYKKLTPNLSVKDVKETVRFYRDILGFTLEMVVPTGKEQIEQNLSEGITYDYAMMRKGEVFVMFMEEDCFKKDLPFLKDRPHGASLSFYIDVEDIDALYGSLKGKVAFVKELETTWYGMKEFYIEDCNGYVLGFGEKS